MDRLPLPFLFLVAIASVFVACRKEIKDSEPTLPSQVSDAKSGIKDCADKVKLECGMLSFDNAAQFQYVYDCLEEAYETHLDAFESQWGNLSEDDYNTMADQLGFVDELPLVQFEAAIGFTSYRATMQALENTFLQGGGDPFLGPDMNNVFDDQVLETLYNKDGAVMIGGIVHYRAPDGSQLTFCSCEKYEQYLLDPGSIDLNDECIVVPKNIFCSAQCDCCKANQVAHGEDPYDSNRKIIWTLRFEYDQVWDGGGYVWNHRSVAKIVHWKVVNGNWKRRRADLLARTEGDYSDSNDQGFCKEPGPYFKENAKKRKQLEAKNFYGAPYYVKTFRTGEAKGYWEYPGANYLTHALEFPC